MLSKALSIFIALFFIGGCASLMKSVTVQETPKFINKSTGKKVKFTGFTMTELNLVGPNKTVTVFLLCDAEGDEERSLEDTECDISEAGNEHMTPGLVTLLGPTFISTTGRVGGDFLIGEGLKGSGDKNETIVQTGMNSNIGDRDITNNYP